MELDFGSPADGNLGISPQREMGAYEALWDEDGATFKTISEKLSKRPDTVPSDLVEPPSVRADRGDLRQPQLSALLANGSRLREHPDRDGAGCPEDDRKDPMAADQEQQGQQDESSRDQGRSRLLSTTREPVSTRPSQPGSVNPLL